ncbi:DUF7064 domain-containing protein [Sciscionella marina]|uniref:DUF7064 domain-containing protein n=1 Tax=Sciscionella marina TaxID=508770 RepID=UPI000373586E|nr:hypothetical protein [Sciscionella marina]
MTEQNQELYAPQQGFVAPRAEDEFLHTGGDPSDYTISETSYLGFNIPESGINGEIYHWYHPNLGIASGGLLLFQGHKQQTAEADYLDYRNFQPLPQSDLHEHSYPTGVRIRVVQPLQEIEVRFRSPDGATSLDLTSTAIMPAAGRADGKHFAQAMRSTGELVLDGEKHTIDSFFTRDRSYLSPRPEGPHAIPPLTWGAAVFNQELAIHFVAHDSLSLSDEQLRWGYVWRHGELRRPVRIRQQTFRAEDGVTPHAADVEIEDEAGELYRLRGRSIARMPMSFWPNMVTNLMLMRYESEDGSVSFGEYQDVVFNSFLRSARRQQ